MLESKIRINELLEVRAEGNECVIYVNHKRFKQCSYILISVPKIEANQDFESIDEISELYNNEHENNKTLISKQEELFAHASNLQAWVENDYDTRILHSNLSFPLLKRLSEIGDPIAQKVFKDEICYRISSGYAPVITYLLNEQYLDVFTREEFLQLFHENKQHFTTRHQIALIKYLYKFDKPLMCFLILAFVRRAMKRTRAAARDAAWDAAWAAAWDAAWAAARDAAWAAARAAAWDAAWAAAWAAARAAAWAAARDAAWAAARDAAWAAARDAAWAAAWAAARDAARAAARAAARDAARAARDAARDAAKRAFKQTMKTIKIILNS